MGKKVAVITWDTGMARFYASQVQDFFGDKLDRVDWYSVEHGDLGRIGKADLYLVSTCAYDGRESIREYLPFGGETVVTRVTVTRQALEKLRQVPRGTCALMVNINQRMVIETMALLNQMGINYIEFLPYHPGMKEVPHADLAITPGEARYVPEGYEIVDIGNRVLTPDTLAEVAFKLGINAVLESEAFKSYLNLVVDNDYSFRRLFDRSIELESLFEILLQVLDVGVIGVDDENRVFAYNQRAEYVVSLPRRAAIGRDAADVLPFFPFEECRRTQQEQKTRLVKVGDVYVNASVVPVMRRGRYLGAFAIVQRFNDAETKQQKMRMQLLDRGYRAKYTFDDIIGESPAIRRACDIARKMARTNAAVLITGESGTGKELFAHAIHQASDRQGSPFVAINCAALPENLLESELFGYEEGAFTGAKKGGKPGFFELAHQGTLFLDEIEGMSQPLQLKLLRVVQEQEVTRVGGNRVIRVDVRIIAATNENLTELVNRGVFRKDLYYRLNALPLRLPPLRERGEDVLVLLEWMERQVGAGFTLTPETRRVLLGYPWPGNIRELRNCVEYLAYLETSPIRPQDLPPEFCGEAPAGPAQEAPPAPRQGEALPPEQALRQAAEGRQREYAFVLGALCQANRSFQPLGRRALAQMAQEEGLFLTEQEVRGILERLSRLGMVHTGRGRGGSRITELGERMWESGLLMG